jgi:hypothetical protein
MTDSGIKELGSIASRDREISSVHRIKIDFETDLIHILCIPMPLCRA